MVKDRVNILVSKIGEIASQIELNEINMMTSFIEVNENITEIL